VSSAISRSIRCDGVIGYSCLYSRPASIRLRHDVRRRVERHDDRRPMVDRAFEEARLRRMVFGLVAAAALAGIVAYTTQAR
jgi:hypothetical protein